MNYLVAGKAYPLRTNGFRTNDHRRNDHQRNDSVASHDLWEETSRRNYPYAFVVDVVDSSLASCRRGEQGAERCHPRMNGEKVAEVADHHGAAVGAANSYPQRWQMKSNRRHCVGKRSKFLVHRPDVAQERGNGMSFFVLVVITSCIVGDFFDQER